MSVPERHSYGAPRRRSPSPLETALDRLQESVAGLRQGIEIRPKSFGRMNATRKIVEAIEEAQKDGK